MTFLPQLTLLTGNKKTTSVLPVTQIWWVSYIHVWQYLTGYTLLKMFKSQFIVEYACYQSHMSNVKFVGGGYTSLWLKIYRWIVVKCVNCQTFAVRTPRICLFYRFPSPNLFLRVCSQSHIKFVDGEYTSMCWMACGWWIHAPHCDWWNVDTPIKLPDMVDFGCMLILTSD